VCAHWDDTVSKLLPKIAHTNPVLQLLLLSFGAVLVERGMKCFKHVNMKTTTDQKKSEQKLLDNHDETSLRAIKALRNARNNIQVLTMTRSPFSLEN
jgi:hypothetical protein